MRQRRRPGLTALFDVAGADGPPTALSSRLHDRAADQCGRTDRRRGAGRAAPDDHGDEIEARAIAAELDRLNRARQQIEIAALAEAEAEALLSLGLEERGAAVVVAGELAAGRRRPPGGAAQGAVRPSGFRLLARRRRTRPGPGRSIAGVDLGKAVRAAVEAGLLVKGGGHAMAAGVTIAKERLGDWRAFLEETAGRAGRARPRRGEPRESTPR